MDSGFNYRVREEWFKEHAPYCSNTFVCREEKCGQVEDWRQNHQTLCAMHWQENKQKEKTLVTTTTNFPLTTTTANHY